MDPKFNCTVILKIKHGSVDLFFATMALNVLKF
jgi:hypothetical protein